MAAAQDQECVLDPRTFNRFAQLVYARCGIVLTEKKEALVQARVGKRMRQLGMKDFADYFRLVDADANGDETVHLLDVISTNVTSFYREARHFEVLTELLRKWEQAGQTTFRIWCAAASTGEEPYTIAFTVRDALHNGTDARILATDISTRVLGRARAAVYTARDLEKVPRPVVNKYFQRQHSADANGGPETYSVVPEVRNMITFARLNLATPPFPMRGPFDVVFCRNVMIYFDDAIRTRLLADCYRLLRPGGYLMVGHAESLTGILSEFKSVEPAVYIKK